MRSSEQHLIDLMFEMVLAATSDPIFCARPREERMEWVANHLKEAGFPTKAVGASWGVLETK